MDIYHSPTYKYPFKTVTTKPKISKYLKNRGQLTNFFLDKFQIQLLQFSQNLLQCPLVSTMQQIDSRNEFLTLENTEMDTNFFQIDQVFDEIMQFLFSPPGGSSLLPKTEKC